MWPLLGISFALTIVLAWIIHMLLSRTLEQRTAFALVLLVGSVLMVIAWHPNLWVSIHNGYADDSFYTLTPMAAWGLVAVSTTLAIVLMAITRLKTLLLQSFAQTSHRLTFFSVDQFANGIIYWISISLIPQLYYFYYQRVFENLPDQWVVDGVMSASTTARLLLVSTDGSLADHFSATLLWVLLLATTWSWLIHVHRHTNKALRSWHIALVFAAGHLLWHSLTMIIN